MLAFLSSCATTPIAPTPTATAALGAHIAGELPTLDGPVYRLSQLQGQPALVAFWASWCAPCRAELPVFATLAKDYSGKLNVVTISVDEDRWAANTFVSGMGLSLVLWDKGGTFADRLKVTDMPTTLLVDRDAVVRFAHVGTLDENELRAEIEQLQSL